MTLIRRNHTDLPTMAAGLLDDFFSSEFNDFSKFRQAVNLPKVNIAELENAYRIEMAAPGYEKEDFKIDLDNDILTLSAENKDEALEENKNDEAQKLSYTKKEFHYSNFKRSFTLPETADVENISAKYENGILVVEIAKKEEAVLKPKKSISIE